jgi:hypothetical protein
LIQFFLFFFLTGFFPSIASALIPGQVMVDPESNSWLVYNRDSNNDGQLDPVFVCGPGDPEDFLYRGTRNGDGTRSGDQQSIISNMSMHGVNSIYLQAIRSHGGDGDSTHNPFISSNPANFLDEDILQQWDGWFNAMDNAGIIIYFFFYDDSAQIWSGDTVGTQEQYFITTLVNRYEHLKHLVWVVGEEYSERYSTARVSNIAALIKSTDDNKHPIANHQLTGITFDHANDPNIDQFAIQYNDTTVNGLHSGMINAWNHAAGKYSINMSESRDHGYGTRAAVRQKNWACAMGGAYVMVIRMDGTSAYNDKMTDCATLAAFFESTDFNTMSPHDELGNTGTWVMANPGKSYMAYRMTGGDFSISGMAAGSYFFRWLDTVSGATVEKRNNVASGTNTFSRPAGISTESAVWITNEADDSPRIVSPVFLLLNKK